MLEQFLEAVSKPRTKCSIVFPGSNLPQWFTHQNDGSSIKIIRPLDLYNGNKLVGYAICSVFHVHEHLPSIRSRLYRTHKLTLHVKADKICPSAVHLLILKCNLVRLYLTIFGYSIDLVKHILMKSGSFNIIKFSFHLYPMVVEPEYWR